MNRVRRMLAVGAVGGLLASAALTSPSVAGAGEPPPQSAGSSAPASPDAERAFVGSGAAPSGTDRLLVVWRKGVQTSARSQARGRADTRVLRRLGNPRFEVQRPAAGQSVAEAIAALADDPRVESVERDGSYTLLGAPNDPLFPKLWGLKNRGKGVGGVKSSNAKKGADANVVKAWNVTKGTNDVVMAIIDSGYRFDAPDLGPVAWKNPGEVGGNGLDDDGNGYVDDTRGWDFVGKDLDDATFTGDNNPTEDNLNDGGHGVHVAGTAGAKGNNNKGITGVTQNSRIMPLRVCGWSTSLGGTTCPYSAIVDAITYAGENGAHVANMSLGGSGACAACRIAMGEQPGTLFVIAAGNSDNDNDASPTYPCVYNPAGSTAGAIDNVVCVAATDQRDRRASFSSYGASTVDLGAPGTETLSVYPKAKTFFKDGFSKRNFGKVWNPNPNNGWGRAGRGDGPLRNPGMNDSPGKKPKANQVVSVVLKDKPKIPSGAGWCYVDFDYAWIGGLAAVELYAGGTQVFRAGATSLRPQAARSDGAAPALTRFQSPYFLAAGTKIGVVLHYLGDVSPTKAQGFWVDNVVSVCNAPLKVKPGYAFLQGTSMATPHVTGAAALLWSADPGASVTEVRDALLDGTTAVPSMAGVTATGGRLNVLKALNQLP